MWLGAALLALSQSTFALAQPAAGGPDTLADVRQALRRCWRWPPESVSSSGMELSVRLTFKRSGEIYGVRITFQSQSSEASEEERAPYNTAVLETLRRCSPLPITENSARRSRGMSWSCISTTSENFEPHNWPVRILRFAGEMADLVEIWTEL